MKSNLPVAGMLLFAVASGAGMFPQSLIGQSYVAPDWCRNLPRPGYKSLPRVPVRQWWFEVYRVAPGVFAIYEPHQWEETISYLIIGQKRALLFDTGMGIGDLKALTSELTSLPIAVLNSHTHTDHTGSNWEFRFVYGLDSDYTRQNSKGSTESKTELEPGKVCGALPAGFDGNAYSTKPWTVTQWIHDGAAIDLGQRQLDVVATPGHAPDSLCLFDKQNGILFTGDSYYPGPIYVFSPGADPDAYQKSMHRVAALAPQTKLVLGAHNFPIASAPVLPQVASAFDAVASGKIKPVSIEDGIATYKSNGFTFLVRVPKSS